MGDAGSSTRSTRDRMLDAAASVMRTHGLARATTKQIAREAGFSEAALYKHFDDKTALFVAVLSERVPSRFTELLDGLPGQVGGAPVGDVLAAVAEEAVAFYRETFPMGASLFSEPTLLAAHRASLQRLGTGPRTAVDALAGYLAAERDGGRVRADADPAAAARLLLGACQMAAFLSAFDDRPVTDGPPPSALVRTVLDGIGPQTG